MKTTLLCTALALSATAAAAESYRFANWMPPAALSTTILYDEFGKDVAERTGGAVEFEMFHGGSLIAAAGIMQGVADQIAHAGQHSSAYTPSANPVSQAITGMAFRNSDPMVLTYAYADFVMTSPAGHGDFRKNGVIPVGSYASPQQYFQCRGTPIRTAADAAGKKTRMAGGFIAAFGADLGVTNVSMPLPEVYAAFGYGNIDCTVNDGTWLLGSTRFAEVVNSVTLLPFPPTFAIPAWIYNPSFWGALTTDQRRAILDASAHAMARMQIQWQKQADAALETAKGMGVELIEPDASLRDKLAAWGTKTDAEMAALATTAAQVPDLPAVLAEFGGYMDKWQKILDAIPDRSDEAAMTAALKENLFDRIDAATYGLN